ncbi:MAG: hypothetical protein K8W52_42650 [Deltaproteobacteria bacterium]|nr:hypothetical protein [Deltaproteobacteria bacterium]
MVPLFEAVINGLHAIDATTPPRGRIRIQVIRRGQQDLEASDQSARGEIAGFRVQDNGIGFTDENFVSFTTSDSTFKASLGGRGVGRFTWLKAFQSVLIDSTYIDGDRVLRRVFSFTPEGINEAPSVPQVDQKASSGTTITLDNIAQEYQKSLPKRAGTIGQRIVDHCLVALRGARVPVDATIEDGDDTFDISGEIGRSLATAKTDTFRIFGEDFKITHLRITSPEASGNRLAFLANGREVRSEILGSTIPHLRSKLTDSNGDTFWCLALVESNFLDASVSSERDAFLFAEETSALFPDEPSLESLRGATIPFIERHLAPSLVPLRERVDRQVQAFVENKAPEYRHVLTMRREEVRQIPPDLSDDRLDLELHRINYKIEVAMREKGQRILDDPNPDTVKYDDFLSEANAVGKANLAKYVVHRRVVLNLFRKALERKADGKYELEEAVHRLIFPLKKTSDEVPYEQLNLWLIDERLAYHAYLASDKELRSVPALQTAEQQRPDLLIFNSPFAFADQPSPYNSILVVEFKRPQRNDYDDDENPIAQVFEYVRKVRSGLARDRAGRPIHAPEHVPFYCYIICDVTPKLKAIADNFDYTRHPNGDGYFGFNAKLSAYIEIISFDQLVVDAEKRNQILFSKLNLPR